MRGVRRERQEKKEERQSFIGSLCLTGLVGCVARGEEWRGNMWPSLKQTLPVMPGRADAKIHLTQDKVFMGGPTLVQVQ